MSRTGKNLPIGLGSSGWTSHPESSEGVSPGPQYASVCLRLLMETQYAQVRRAINKPQ